MSLKAFHVLFVTISTLFSLGFGVWASREWAAGGDTQLLVLAAVGFASGGILLVYGRWFLHKMRDVGYL